MNSLAARDKLFSDLHAAVFKRHGYKKTGHWVTRIFGGLTHSFYLRASRFGSEEKAPFWIDVQVFSENWHRLVFPERPYKGPSEGPSLYSKELGSWCSPPQASHVVTSSTNINAVIAELAQAAEEGALPELSKCQAPEALLEHLIAQAAEGSSALGIVGLLYLLGRETEAREHMLRAKHRAVHENELRFLELRERNIWRNAA
jgi:hypothetical protein